MASLIYKIASKPLWAKAVAAGRFDGAPVDVQDGFIHFSTAAQARETARRHFAHNDDLLLIAVDPDQLDSDLRWESSRGGALFPHLYGPLSLDAVQWAVPLPQDPAGEHQFPDGFA